jgi:hypothetical protein
MVFPPSWFLFLIVTDLTLLFQEKPPQKSRGEEGFGIHQVEAMEVLLKDLLIPIEILHGCHKAVAWFPSQMVFLDGAMVHKETFCLGGEAHLG